MIDKGPVDDFFFKKKEHRWPGAIIRNLKSKTSFCSQSERSIFRPGLTGLQSKIGLAINGMGNLIYDRKFGI